MSDKGYRPKQIGNCALSTCGSPIYETSNFVRQGNLVYCNQEHLNQDDFVVATPGVHGRGRVSLDDSDFEELKEVRR